MFSSSATGRRAFESSECIPYHRITATKSVADSTWHRSREVLKSATSLTAHHGLGCVTPLPLLTVDKELGGEGALHETCRISKLILVTLASRKLPE